jgi:X-Pro dipeptidyl-peptidase
MKINQFAYVPTAHDQIISELTRIGFLNSQSQQINNPQLLFRKLLLQCYLEHSGKTTRIQKIANLMATPTIDANTYTKSGRPLTKEAFYNIALQLLSFLDDLDFSLADPLGSMKKLGLPMIPLPEHLDCNHLIDAWYRLLNTRNKYGQTLIDYLAGRGYYHFLDDHRLVNRPLVFNGKAQATFDTGTLIHEVVYVEAPLDSDQDGQRDLLKVCVIRPAESNHGLKVPIIYTADPYAQGMNVEWSKKYSHNNNRSLTHKEPNQLTYQDVMNTYNDANVPKPRLVQGQSKETEETFTKFWSYSLNDYFLARGFAVVYASGIGTKDSDGFRTTGTRDETISTTSVIEWLHGDRIAFTNKSDRIAIKAWWSNGNVGMTGRSYLGTLANASILSGVAGLKTAVVEAGLSDYYDYYRENGLVVAPDGDDADSLAEWTFSRQREAGDYAKIKLAWLTHLKAMRQQEAHDSGNYNQFWDARRLLKQNHAQADVLLVHGLNDWNVKTAQAWNMRKALKKRSVTQKLILHQGQHEYLNNFRSFDYTDLVNLWLTNKLLAVDNHADDVIDDVIVQDNAQPETWTGYKDWGGQQTTWQVYQLTPNNMKNLNGNNTFSDRLANELFNDYTQDLVRWRNDLYTRNGSPMDTHCIRLLTAPLNRALVIDGRPQITLRAKSDANVGMISVALVDYGQAHRLGDYPQVIKSQKILSGYNWRKDDLREFLPQKKVTDFKRITEAHLNMQNRQNSYRVDELIPGKFYELQFEFQPTFWHLLSGHQLGIVIYASDMAYTVHGNQAINYQLDLTKSSLKVPILKN